ncbi:MAG: DUF3429 domain-containing protein [Pseudomonadota bacterium]
MTTIPTSALILGLAGVLPFAFGTLAQIGGIAPPYGLPWDVWLLFYGLTILSFMSGCIWAFAARDEDVTGYALSTVPALYGTALVMVAIPLGWIGEGEGLFFMLLGFLALLLLDRRALARGQTPPWWLQLRLLLTGLVIICLAIGAFL